MNQDLNRKELLSALVDGEVQGEDFGQALSHAEDSEGRESWQLYHLIGDVLRSPELAHHSQHDLLSGLRTRLAQEPLPVAPPVVALPQVRLEQVAPPQAVALEHAANDGSFRWKLAAGFASVAAVAAIGWNMAGMTAAGGAQLAAAPQAAPAVLVAQQDAQAAAQAVAQVARQNSLAAGGADANASTVGTGEAIMLRDPRLDELLAAHQQFGNKTALQMPADFLRNASFARSGPATRH